MKILKVLKKLTLNLNLIKFIFVNSFHQERGVLVSKANYTCAALLCVTSLFLWGYLFPMSNNCDGNLGKHTAEPMARLHTGQWKEKRTNLERSNARWSLVKKTLLRFHRYIEFLIWCHPLCRQFSVSMTLALLLFAFLPSASACVALKSISLSASLLKVTRSLTQVENVANVSSCGELCVRETSCAGLTYKSATRLCHLLTAAIDLEGDAALADVHGPFEAWTVAGRGFGNCSTDFFISWRHSRYKLVTDHSVTWQTAVAECEARGAKLAEITSEEERNHVSQQIKAKFQDRDRDFYVGGQQLPGAQEPDAGFIWRRSGLPISQNMFHSSEPNDNNPGERFTSAWYSSSGPFLLDDLPHNVKRKYLCECHTL